MQKLTSSPKAKLTLRNAVLFLYGGLGILFILLMIAFLLYNVGTPEKSIAAGSIASVDTGMWGDDKTWNLDRIPVSNDEIIISDKEEVTITHNVYLENTIIKVYGTLKLKNSDLRLDETSTILIAKTGKIVSEGSEGNMLVIGSYSWVGNQINSIGIPSQLTSSGESSENLLPVELSYFKGSATHKNSVLLEWKTLSEANNSHFTIEKKAGASDFIKVDTVRGAGNSDLERLYTYEDKHVFAASVYYRLKQTDFDGNFKYFNIIHITTEKSANDSNSNIKIIQAGPNPFSEKFILLYNSPSDNHTEILLKSHDGKIQHREELKPVVGENEYTLPGSVNLAPGVYVVSLIQNGNSEHIKMIKK